MNRTWKFILCALWWVGASCATSSPTPPQRTPPSPAPVKVSAPEPEPKPEPEPEPEPQETEEVSETSKPEPCPADMIYVEGDYCKRLEHKCLKKGASKPRHPARCLKFAQKSRCRGRTRHQRFCVDTYEYPNKKGAHPPALISAWDADLLCREQGKRLCWESEWTMACEGPKRLPYPYGYVRDNTRCNIDKPYLKPGQRTIYGSDASKSEAELRRLDQSVLSGSMEGCVSDHGVFDTTGNFGEWVYLEKPGGKSTWAGTKGGHWVPVRNECRLTSVTHPESWRYYPLSTRCCKDPDPSALPPRPSSATPLWRPPRPHSTQHWFLDGHFSRGWTPDATPKP